MIRPPPAPNYQVTADSIKRDYLEKLRDKFAGKALQGILTTSAISALNGLDGYELHTAKAAYKLADAMLKARNKQCSDFK